MSIIAFDSLPDYVTVSPRKVKWARIQVQPNGEVLIVVPNRVSRAKVVSFFEEKRGWIEQKRRSMLARQQENSLGLASGELLLFGQGYEVVLDTQCKRHAVVDHERKQIRFAKNLLAKEPQQNWYRDFAKQYLSLRLVQLAEQHGFTFNRLYVREQKTRWGSCSSRGNISLNRKLVKAPVSVSDYVILHELAHTEIMNHSPAFWRRVASLAPDYQAAKQWLRTYGAQL